MSDAGLLIIPVSSNLLWLSLSMCREALQCCTAKGGKDRAARGPNVIPCVQKAFGGRIMYFSYRTTAAALHGEESIKHEKVCVNVNNPHDTRHFPWRTF